MWYFNEIKAALEWSAQFLQKADVLVHVKSVETKA